MKILNVALLLIGSATALSGQWLFGASGGYGFVNNVNASGVTCCGTAGFAPGFVAGFVAGHNVNHLSGEIRYEYMQSNLRLTSGGQTADFSGAAQAVHYDVRYHTSIGSESPTQFYALAGGGLKYFTGNGTEAAYQPLSQFGYFTKTSQTRALLTAGVGVEFALGRGLSIRAEVRDFLSGFPTKVLTPPMGIKYGSVLNDLVPMVSLVYSK